MNEQLKCMEMLLMNYLYSLEHCIATSQGPEYLQSEMNNAVGNLCSLNICTLGVTSVPWELYLYHGSYICTMGVTFVTNSL